MTIIYRGPRTRAERLRDRRQKLTRYALWVAGGLILAGAAYAYL